MRLALQAMGTRFELVLVADAEHDVREEEAWLTAAGEAALEVIREQHRRLSLFEAGSFLAHVNRRAAGGWVELDLDTFELFVEARAVWRDSGGAFDPSVAPLMRALGLHGEQGGGGGAVVELAAARAAVGLWAFELDPARRAVRFSRADLALDLGAIAKGHALDLAAAILREAGVGRALLHGGTSAVAALGAPPGAAAWRVELAGTAGWVCALRDGALAVSAPHGRRSKAGGHVLDPRAKRPARGVTLAAVAGALDGAGARRADAWSTALVAGAHAPRGDSGHGLAWLIVRGGENGGPARSTAAAPGSTAAAPGGPASSLVSTAATPGLDAAAPFALFERAS